ncbi:MAG: flagellar hook-basal body complex protein FliE [Salinibacter sp.]
MKAAQLQQFRTASLQSQDDGGDELPDLQEATDGPSFEDTLKQAIDSVDQSQEVANEKISAFVAGEEQNLHEVMISMKQAKLQFELMNEVRNRGLQAYKKLMQTRI